VSSDESQDASGCPNEEVPLGVHLERLHDGFRDVRRVKDTSRLSHLLPPACLPASISGDLSLLEVGADVSRVDADDTYPQWSQLYLHTRAERSERSLCRRVEREPRLGCERGEARDVHDCPASSLHQRDRGPRGVDRRHEVRRGHPFNRGVGRLLQRPEEADPSVVHENVEGAEPLARLPHDALGAFFRRNVGHKYRRLTTSPHHFAAYLLERTRAPRRQKQLHLLRSHIEGYRPAYAARGTGHDAHFILQIQEGSSAEAVT